MKSDRKLQGILSAPTLSDSDKSQIVAELEKHTGGQDKSNTVKNFLQALAENNRLSILEGVCEKFGTLMSAAKGEMELTITTAQVWTCCEVTKFQNTDLEMQDLDNKLLKRLQSAVEKSEYSQGKKLKVTTKVNPEIIGGIVVEIGERTIDYSVAGKVSRLNKMLTEAV